MRTQRRRAFTLIELLVVILILAILAALIVPKVVGRTDDAKRAKAAQDIQTLRAAINNFRLDTDRYPTTEEGLQALVEEPGDVRNWRRYVDNRIPTDPWGNDYVYEYNGSDDFTLMSLGADGAPGGEGNDADIGEEAVD